MTPVDATACPDGAFGGEKHFGGGTCPVPDWRVYAAITMASASVVGLQLVLMRCLAVARWHHFAYLVISTALLGFGASGTVLTWVGKRLAARFERSMHCLLVALAVAPPICFRAAEALPIDTYQVMLRGSQAGLLVAYHLLLLVPFLLGALSIGLPLMTFRQQVPSLYALNMIGSGAGAASAVGLMFLVRTEHLLWGVTAVAAAAALAIAAGQRRGIGIRAGGVILPVAGVLLFSGPLHIDPYKPLASYQQLSRQGNGRLVAETYGPRGQIDVYESSVAHETLFASPQAAMPPPQMTLIVDGAQTTPVFRIENASEAAILDETPMAAVYRVFQPSRVLLLGETGGTNIWLARRFGATRITVVQANRQIVELLKGPLAKPSGNVLGGPDVQVEVAELRGFLCRTRERFDLIQLVSLESMAIGAPGAMALNESYVPTVEGITQCLDRLSPGGIVAVARGIEEPPRDNIRLFATFTEALGRRGVTNPAGHLLQFRNYLAACTVAADAPIAPVKVRQVREVLSSMAMDPVWYPGMPDDQANRIDPRPGPAATHLSYLDWAARQILSPHRSAFYATYAFDVRPATDDRPFFFDFFRWRSLRLYMRSYGRYWLARMEWGYVVLIAALAWSAAVGAAIILLPLLWLRKSCGPPGVRMATFAYYTALGAGYMLLEMAMIQQFTLLMAEPVFAVAVVLAAFLIFSGIGSAWAGRRTAPAGMPVQSAIGMIVVMGALYAAFGRHLLMAAVGEPFAVRLGVCLLAAALLATPMGIPFPRGLVRLDRIAPGLVPWAWGANGLASVVAAVLAVVVAISIGFTAVVWMSIIAYGIAGVAQRGLRG
jgi:hypothetical protein